MSSSSDEEPIRSPVVPAYVRIAVALGRDIQEQRVAPGERLPSERALAGRFEVNRQTVRSALQLLRDDGLIITGKRGSFAVAPSRPAVDEPADLGMVPFPGGAGTMRGVRSRARLSHVSLPPSLAMTLGLRPGQPTLMHHHRVLDEEGHAIQDAVTYFTPAALSAIPELSRYHRRPRGHEPDLRLLYQWMERAGLRPRLCESISLSRPDPKRPYASPIQLSVRRHVHDCHDRLLELTDLSFPASWEHLVFEIASPSMSLPRARALIRP